MSVLKVYFEKHEKKNVEKQCFEAEILLCQIVLFVSLIVFAEINTLSDLCKMILIKPGLSIKYIPGLSR